MKTKKKADLRNPHLRARQSGAGVVEFMVVAPTLLFLSLGIIQSGLAFHAKSTLNLAAHEAARSGALANATVDSIRDGLARGLTPYYGGGTSIAALTASRARALADLALYSRIEIISPTPESFDDYSSPSLKERIGASDRTIPNSNLAVIQCPPDHDGGCKSDPNSNKSGQTLADANLLKVRITYGIPTEKQVPFVGRFYTWALGVMNTADTDAFRKGLVAAGRIPLVTQATVRMQSPAIQNIAMTSNPGKGNGGNPQPGPVDPPGDPLPTCPYYDATCTGGGSTGGGDPGGGGGGGGDPPVCTGVN